MDMSASFVRKSFSRRQLLGMGAFAAVAGLGLTACSGEAPAPTGSEPAAAGSSEGPAKTNTEIDVKAYDKLLASGPVAAEDVVAASTWASKVKQAGTLRVGGVETSTLFSLKNPDDGKVRGFDAGLSQLLARYITGKEANTELLQVTSDTRESVLQNDQVDSVFGTYSITDERKKVVAFAGPYYTTQQSILVLADNKDIDGVDDLNGKTVAVQSGSTGPDIVKELAPDATQQEFKTDEEARGALDDGRVDAYVIDANMQLGSMVKNPGKYRLAGDPFGPEDSYGIGLPLDSDAKPFVNDFLKQVEEAGLWEELWKVCIGDRAGIDDVPEPPTIEA